MGDFADADLSVSPQLTRRSLIFPASSGASRHVLRVTAARLPMSSSNQVRASRCASTLRKATASMVSRNSIPAQHLRSLIPDSCRSPQVRNVVSMKVCLRAGGHRLKDFFPALAHLLPGQPLSMDRKNRRAARDAAAAAAAVSTATGGAGSGGNGHGPNDAPPGSALGNGIKKDGRNGVDPQPSLVDQSPGKGMSLPLSSPPQSPRHSLGLSSPPRNSNLSPRSGQAYLHVSSPRETPIPDQDSTSHFSEDRRSSLSPPRFASPPVSVAGHAGAFGSSTGRTLHRSVLSESSIFAPSQMNGYDGEAGVGSPAGRSARAVNRNGTAQKGRDGQGRNALVPFHLLGSPEPATASSFLPSTGAQMAYSPRESYRGSMSPLSSPRPLPSSLPGGNTSGSGGVFGTSPFSAPGSKSLFLSYNFEPEEDLNRQSKWEDARRRTDGSIFSHASAKPMSIGGRNGGTEMQDADNLVFEEDCLPSSLSDLLTPDEIRRRDSRHGRALDSFQSHSVPVQPLPGSYFPDWPDEASPPNHNPIAANGFRDAHGNGTTIVRDRLLNRQSDNASLSDQGSFRETSPFANVISPTLHARVLASHAPGSSLPQGLAAGLSRLHLIPAQHTGDTPPSSNASAYAASPPLNNNTVGFTSPLSSPRMNAVGASSGLPPGFALPAPVGIPSSGPMKTNSSFLFARRPSGLGASSPLARSTGFESAGNHFSAIGQLGHPDASRRSFEDDFDCPFEMD